MNRKLKTILSVALSAMAITSVLAGCGKKEKEIEFWTVFTGADGTNMTKLVEEYNKTNPKVKVKHRPIEANDLYTKIPTVVSSGKEVPDLTIVHVERLPLFAENGMLTPLNDYITANGKIKEENYVPSAWKAGENGGKRYSVPLDVHSFVTYYNKDLMAKYGAGVLDDGVITIDEVKKIGEASQKDGIAGMGITWMRVKFLSWYAQLGGELSDDGTKPSFSNATSEKVLNEIKGLVDAKFTTQDGDDPIQLFKAGKVVVCPEGIWMQNTMNEVKELNWGMTHMVTFDASKKVNWTSSHQMVMLKNPDMTDERAAAIMDFVTWVGENSLEWARAGQNPASLKILENEEFKKMPHSFLVQEPETLKIFNYKYYGYAVEALDKIVAETIFSKMDVKAGLDQAVKETEDKIATSK